ncbi:uncharacterized protein LOC117338231 [Pecten maximus]|uniref:uncharacterized protein LOC117338231 n=1 Tax=Pecten maximus TaxID=6579 RepID=UPI001458682C|nr:uncharacterized protein LOC117338231 [Pecten maximus]
MSSKQSDFGLIFDLERAQTELSMLLKENVIGVRMESGYNPEESSNMVLSLIIISHVSGRVFVFDVLRNPTILQTKSFKTLLESERPIKVMFHPENECKLLWRSNRILLHGVFDPQTLYMVKEAIQKKLPTRKLGNQRKTLTEMCHLYHVECRYDKKLVKKMFTENPSLFMERSDMGGLMGILEESAKCLIPLYEKMKGELDIAVVQEKYSQMLEECLCAGLQGPDKRQFERQKLERNYLETKQFRKEHGNTALSKGDKYLLRRSRRHSYWELYH